MDRSIKLLDERFESLLDSLIIEQSESELTPEKRKLRREKADADEFEFCRIYFPQIFSEPFNAVHRHIRSLGKGKYTISGARRIGKSAYTYVAKAIRKIAIGNGGLIGIVMRTLDKGSVERTAALVRLIKKNPKLMYDYNINIQQDKKGFYIINNTSLIAVSVDVGLRAILDEDFQRFSLVIGDDLYNKNTVRSENDNEKVTEFILSEVDGQMEDNGLRIVLGNSINEDCPIMRLKAEYPENHFSLPALINGKTCWPESKKYTTEYWENKRDSIPFDVWMGEYMDEPLQKGEILDIDWIKPVNINKLKIVASLSAIDPARGESPSACFKGIATMGILSNGDAVMLDVYIRKENYLSVFDYVFSVRGKYPHWKALLFENDFSQFDFAKPYYEQWRKERKSSIPIIPFNASELTTQYYGSDKDSRIMNLVYPHQSGKFFYSNTIFEYAGKAIKAMHNDAKLYLSQYVSFGKSKQKLDGLDAAATAFIMLPRYIETGSFKPLKKRRYSNQEDAWLNRGNFSFRR